MLQQIARRRSNISDNIRNLYESYKRQDKLPSWREYSSLLKTEVQIFSKVFIVVDALDEFCETNNSRHVFLNELQKLLPPARLLFTSRPNIADIPLYFKNYSTLEVLARDEDIKKYIDERISQNRRLKHFVQADCTLRDTIIETVLSNVKGM